MESCGNGGHNGSVSAQKIATRVPHIAAFLRRHYGRRPLVGAEIGVYRGDSAMRIMNALTIKEYYLIDPYIKYAGYKNIYHTRNLADSKRLARQRLTEFVTDEELHFIYKKSEDAVGLVPDRLDFVYIDGNHAYEYVKRDIELYCPKLAENGVLGGHDYLDLPDNREEPIGAKRAIDEFVELHRLSLGVGVGDWPEWWVVCA